ncbi:MAG TPA: NUDIX domain-containing protein, partial [Chthoniobacterales bacterium]|nr:NUDIX domain-containing protein [Chthoniobacterales bacterium]
MAWIEDADKSVLLVRQATGLKQWTLPGGKVKPGESLERALKREVYEETTLRVNIGSLLGVLDRHDKDAITLLFAAFPQESAPKRKRKRKEIDKTAFRDRLPKEASPSAKYFWSDRKGPIKRRPKINAATYGFSPTGVSFMYESIISACKVIDEFGLPRAIGNLRTDRFVFANDSFLKITGLERDEILLISLSEIVKFYSTSSGARKKGISIPIAVRTSDQKSAIGGHAAFGPGDLVFLMIPLHMDSDSEVDAGIAAGQERERQRLSDYIHHRLGPELMAIAFSIESLRGRLKEAKHPPDAELKQIGRRIDDLFESV